MISVTRSQKNRLTQAQDDAQPQQAVQPLLQQLQGGPAPPAGWYQLLIYKLWLLFNIDC